MIASAYSYKRSFAEVAGLEAAGEVRASFA